MWHRLYLAVPHIKQFSKEVAQMASKHTFNILTHEGNAKQNIEISPHTSQNGLNQENNNNR
jgi:hypothetical protein